MGKAAPETRQKAGLVCDIVGVSDVWQPKAPVVFHVVLVVMACHSALGSVDQILFNQTRSYFLSVLKNYAPGETL